MQIIISHNHLDFDGLACMVGAKHLYPKAELVFAGGLSSNVQRFMSLHKDSLPVKRYRELPLSRIRRVVVVDTNSPRRLGDFCQWITENPVDIHVYDHHPLAEDTLPASFRLIDQVGAATTLLVEKIQEKGKKISSFDATVMALGIYEDTGSLTFVTTTPRDVRAAAYLLECGANLQVVANFIETTLTDEQKALFNRLLASTSHVFVNGIDVLIASGQSEHSIGNLDLIAHKLAELEAHEVLIVLVQMEKRVYMVARSKTDYVSVGDLCSLFGGGGHSKAASATIKGKELAEVLRDLREVLPEKVRPPLTAKDIMSSPVKTVSPSLSIAEAGKIMLRYGHTGLPVLENGQLVGVISRRDVDKARLHGLAHAPVKGYMARRVVTAKPSTTLSELQYLLVKNDIGRLPIVDEQGGLVGLVSRTDILRTFHGHDYPEDHRLIYDGEHPGEEVSYRHGSNLQMQMVERLPLNLYQALRVAGEVAQELGMNVYAVGGFVRDLLLEMPNLDVDLVVEGDGLEFARALARRMSAEVRVHERFSTAVVIRPDGSKIDVATARVEYYEYPAALPEVERSNLKQDMYRRDFTINAMAIQLNGERFGELIDFFGGCRDLSQGLIRVLYNLSFVEDPTRIIRAVRFEQRYRFSIEPQTKHLLEDAVERHYLSELSASRVRDELMLILDEKDPQPALRRLEQLGIMEQIAPEVDLNHQVWRMLGRLPKVLAAIQNVVGEDRAMKIDTRLVYWMLLFRPDEAEKARETAERFRLNRRYSQVMLLGYQIEEKLNRLEARAGGVKMSTLHKLIGAAPMEVFAYLMACTSSLAWQNQLLHYLKLRETARPSINGGDLKKIGLKPGPQYREILDRLLALRLDGLVNSREEELQMIQEWIKEKEGEHAF